MKNKFKIYTVFIIFFLINLEAKSQDEFNFNVTEIQILDNGNKFIGNKKGEIFSNSGIIITANQFEYDKELNLLNASGDVKIQDKVNNYLIYSEKIIYDKNKELILTEQKSKAVSINDNLIITASNFEYFKNLNIFSAYKNILIEDKIRKYNLTSDFVKYSINDGIIISKGNSKILNLNDQTNITSENLNYNIKKNIINANKNVVLTNKKKKYKIFTNEITYYKNDKKILTKGKTSAEINSKYKINSSNILFFLDSMELSSDDKTVITDKHNIYNTSRFKYYIEDEFLKAEDILVISDYKKIQNDKYFFENGMINLSNQNFVAGKTAINVRKDIFDNTDNDPRILGRSAKKKGKITRINKGFFTSCKKNKDNDCPPWVLQASEIKHDQEKKEIFYKNAILKVYDIPVLYFPKFFHPDPTVKRRSGILKPTINDSNTLGSSLTIPYFHVLSEKSDLTLAPTIFDTGSNFLQNEFRTVSKNTNTIINFGHVRDYKSKSQNKIKNIGYFFSKLNFDLDLTNFTSSKVNFNFEKVTNDNFLKIFESNFNESTSSVKPSDNSIMSSELVLKLDHENYNFTSGFSSYENLQKNNNDRYQYILPYYDFNRTLGLNFLNGTLNFNSNGSNDLNNTNQLKTKITNNLSYSSIDYFTKSGFKNNFNLNLKNLNSIGKNVSDYKNSPQVELSSLFEANSVIPFKKETKDTINFLTPKASLRFNPSDMKNHKTTDKTINVGNIFSVDRFGLGDTYESGKSITLGVDYKREKLKKKSDETLEEMNKYFEMKLATVLRDKEENFIPSKTTLNKKTSNLFGSMSTNFLENLELNYNFAINKNLDDVEYNDLSTLFTFDKFSTTFNFVEYTNEMGSENFIKNTTSYKFNDNNYIKFNTRRNRKINLTEFYDLVYEYKNDCLTAGLKYKKTYYEDKDLTPSEDLFFTVTFIPLTTFDQKIDKF